MKKNQKARTKEVLSLLQRQKNHRIGQIDAYKLAVFRDRVFTLTG